MAQANLEIKTEEEWKTALGSWNHPTVPHVIVARTQEELKALGEVGAALKGELAFMQYPNFQTYINLENVVKNFKQDSARGTRAVSTHELGHRFCPYDTVTSIILRHAVQKELEGKKLPYSAESASNIILNLFTDMSINTTLARRGDKDIPWAYQQLSQGKKDESLWKVYARSMELAWLDRILPTGAKLTEEETKAAEELAGLFGENCFDRSGWKNNIKTYARVISPFLKNQKQDQGSSMDDSSGNIPKELDEQASQELAKRLAELGSNGLPANPQGLKEFREIMAGFGEGNEVKASIAFYDRLSDAYQVMFATRPFGKPRINPFQPIKWNPSMGADRLDVDYSVQTGGRMIPGVNTHAWNTRKRESHGGLEEVVPNLDIYLDSSQSMPNPVETVSLPVLAGFVAAKKAYRKGASIRATNFSGERQAHTQESTRDLQEIYETLVKHYNGGTVFPTRRLLQGQDPKQVLIITDAVLGNEENTAEAVRELRKRHKGNKVTVYEINPQRAAGYLREAGAEVIHGTTADIFKRVIGKADEVYVR